MRRAVQIFLVATNTAILLSIVACNNAEDKKADLAGLRDSAIAIVSDTSGNKLTPGSVDSTVHRIDSAVINGGLYKAVALENSSFFIRNAKDSIVFHSNELDGPFVFDDFNKDGFEDIRFQYLSNVPGVEDLLLFDPENNNFVLVENFSSYPAPVWIGKTKYLYSYSRAGCADMNWFSDLFYIENFKTIRIGTIRGVECGGQGEKDGIYISTITGETDSLIKILPVKTIYHYKNLKWGFIEEYWNRNYKRFARFYKP